jgi:hypothetical protein
VVPVLGIPLDDRVVKAFRRVYAAVGEPWRLAKTGRPPKRRPDEYALALFARSFWGWTFREAACILKVPKTCLHWASKRLALAWVRALVERTALDLREKFVVKCRIADSTGVSVHSSGFKRRFQRRAYWKLHAIVDYAPWAHKLWFSVARATRGAVHDVVIGRRLLEKTPPSELYADKAYDDKKFYKIAFKHGFTPCMQQRKNAARRTGVRGKIWRSYDDRKRKKYRGRIEAAFGGFANRYHSRINERKTSTRRRACEMWAITHNIRTLAKSLQIYLWDRLLEISPATIPMRLNN